MHTVFAVASVVGNALVEVGGFAPFPPVYEPQVLRLPFGSFRMTAHFDANLGDRTLVSDQVAVHPFKDQLAHFGQFLVGAVEELDEAVLFAAIGAI